MSEPAVPLIHLPLVRCKDSRNCRKAGMNCSMIYANCKGHSCTTAPSEADVQTTTGDHDDER